MADVKNKFLASSHKARYWWAIVYPESAPENWRDKLNDMLITWVASPLHDKDLNEDGSFKKPHYHVIILFDNTYTYSYASGIFSEINAVFPDLASKVIIKKISSAIKYLYHENSKEKASYDKDNLTFSEDFVIERYEDQPTHEQLKEQDRKLLIEILDYIEENNVTELNDLVVYCRFNNLDWLDYISHKTVFINFNITSKRNKEKERATAESM